LEADQKLILTKVIRLVYAAVDVINSNGWLEPALGNIFFFFFFSSKFLISY